MTYTVTTYSYRYTELQFEITTGSDLLVQITLCSEVQILVSARILKLQYHAIKITQFVRVFQVFTLHIL